jgi:hypothetical protein
VKQLREEKLVFAAQQYVAAKLGREFTEPEPWTLDGVFQETSARTPIIFILSTGNGSCWKFAAVVAAVSAHCNMQGHVRQKAASKVVLVGITVLTALHLHLVCCCCRC